MTSSQESALHYPLGDTLPGPAQTLEVTPGVKWIRMALPFALAPLAWAAFGAEGANGQTAQTAATSPAAAR